jgi:hypothetical protein
MGFPLTPIKWECNKPNKFAVCDIEAHKWIRFKLIGFYDGETYQYFKCMSEFFDFLAVEHSKTIEANKKGEIKMKIFAHFGGKYDFNFLLQELALELDETWKIGDLIPRGSGILCFDAYYKNITVSFFDSSALLPFSLAKLTESFGVECKKGSFDFDKWDGQITQELLDYLEDDCKGLYQVLEAFYKWPLIKFAGASVTMASQAMKVFRTFMKEELWPLPRHADAFIRQGYFGGRTEIFKPYFEQKKGGLPLLPFDANSLYPAVMRENEFPGNFDCFSFKYDGSKMGFFEAEVEVPHDMYVPPLGTMFAVPTMTEHWKKGKKSEKMVATEKFIFPTGKFSGIWSTAELEYAKTLGVKVLKTGRGCYLKNAGYLFKEFIDTLYEMRMQAQKICDGVGDVLTKLLMNSLYGKFGIVLERELLTIDRGQSGVIPDIEIKKGKKSIRLCKTETKLNTFSNVGISAWVTSLSRIKMHKFYMECERELWYTDTDSLYTTKRFTDSTELGFLKWEGKTVIPQAAFLLPKTYMLRADKNCFDVIDDKGKKVKSSTKIVMKGFDKKKIRHFTIEDFMTALEGDLKLITSQQTSKFCTFRTAMRKGAFLAMTEDSTRTLKTRYDKRRIVKTKNGYDTVPLHIVDGKITN